MKIIALIIVLIFSSCETHTTIETHTATIDNESNIELLKQLAFCTCITKSISAFNKLDSLEIYSGPVRVAMEEKGLYTKRIDPVFDNLANEIVQKQIQWKQDTLYKAEGAAGTTSYIYECLQLYRSKKLDSIVRTFPRSNYIVVFVFQSQSEIN